MPTASVMLRWVVVRVWALRSGLWALRSGLWCHILRVCSGGWMEWMRGFFEVREHVGKCCGLSTKACKCGPNGLATFLQTTANHDSMVQK